MWLEEKQFWKQKLLLSPLSILLCHDVILRHFMTDSWSSKQCVSVNSLGYQVISPSANNTEHPFAGRQQLTTANWKRICTSAQGLHYSCTYSGVELRCCFNSCFPRSFRPTVSVPDGNTDGRTFFSTHCIFCAFTSFIYMHYRLVLPMLLDRCELHGDMHDVSTQGPTMLCPSPLVTRSSRLLKAITPKKVSKCHSLLNALAAKWSPCTVSCTRLTLAMAEGGDGTWIKEERLVNEGSLLTPEQVLPRIARYGHSKGHLGDQGLYTLLALDDPQLLYSLPCGWNRQLCR